MFVWCLVYVLEISSILTTTDIRGNGICNRDCVDASPLTLGRPFSEIAADKTNKTEGEFSRRVIQVEIGYYLDPPTFRFPSMMDKGNIPDTGSFAVTSYGFCWCSLLGRQTWALICLIIALLSHTVLTMCEYSIRSLGLLGSTWFIDLVLVQGTETLKRILERCEIGCECPLVLFDIMRGAEDIGCCKGGGTAPSTCFQGNYWLLIRLPFFFCLSSSSQSLSIHK